MSGGLKRLATVVRQYQSRGNTLWIDAGDVTETPVRQSQIKFETYAEFLKQFGADAFFYTKRDQSLGEGGILAGKNLASIPWIASIPTSDLLQVDTTIKGIKISSKPTDTATIRWVDGDLDEAKATSSAPLIIYAADGTPSVTGSYATPGSHLRGVIIARFKGQKLLQVSALPLVASISEDEKATKIYNSYLKRVRQENLVARKEKSSNQEFVGSKKCISCHESAGKIHQSSAHSHAFETLKRDLSDADPDCVNCHVVGIESSNGFPRNPDKLSEVGCESCHSSEKISSSSHALDPKRNVLGKVSPKTCQSCHTSTTSPGFNFLTYWSKIKH
jgi:nitrate/TMAO reductase-like tetraheme cytochrome c subunit